MLSNILYLVLVISIICNVCQFLYSGSQTGLDNGRRSLMGAIPLSTATVRNTKSQMINGIEVPAGTRKIFMDLGANNGESTSFFLNSAPGGGVAGQGGDKGSVMEGLGSSGDWEVVMFEANTNYTKRLNILKKNAMEKHLAKSITIYNGTAIAKTTGPITFIIDNPFNGDAGATTMSESASAVGPHFTIPGIGIADLFHTMRIHHNDFVVVKIDIEGAEFELMRHMITHGLHSRIDILAVEFHENNYFVFGRDPKIQAKYKAYHECLNWMVEDVNSMKMVHWGR